MKQAIIQRLFGTEFQMLGDLSTINDNQLFVAHTLELPDKNNLANESCIPAGRYICRWTWSPSFKKFTYEIIGVEGRAGIRIHAANLYTQIRGCVALGSANKDINFDGNQDVIHSGATMAAFESIMNKEDFELIIFDPQFKLAA